MSNLLKLHTFLVFHIPAEERKGINADGFGGGEAHKRYF
jgi:hypothetical protein